MSLNQPSAENIVPFGFKLIPAHKPEELHESMRSALSRNLPLVSNCQAHGEPLSVAGGGPSLADTYTELNGYVGAVNGSLAFLLDRGIVPQMCGICDPSPHMVDIIEADPRVTYFVASIVHPSVFDKLIKAGCRVYLWHASSVPGGQKVLDKEAPGSLVIGGGSTMGLRWIPLGYTNGFRKFDLHGMDSSFRIDPERGRASHAYADHQDAKDWINFEGYQTRPNFIGQVVDFIGWMERLKQPDVDPVEIRVFGDGLLQSKWAEWKAANPHMHEGNPKRPVITDGFIWPKSDRHCAPAMQAEAENIGLFMRHIHERRVVVQAGGNVGVYPVHLAQYFSVVHTFEPDPENYACLAHNIGQNPGRIAAYNAAVGAEVGNVSTEMFEPNNAGAVRVVEGGGDIPMRAIDDLNLQVCDLIWLDIEGYELKALQGASTTIAKHRPAVIIEEKHLPEMFGLPEKAAREWLVQRGYKEIVAHGRDHLFMPSTERGVLTIAAVQVGNYQDRGAEYVAKLFASIKRHLPDGIEARFACLTDDPATVPEGVEALAVEPGIRGWWSKLALFKPGMFEAGSRVLYLDLDTVIVGDLGELARYDGPLALMQDVYRSHGLQSSIMAWEAGAFDHIWAAWDGAGRPDYHPGGDQAWIELMVPDAVRLQDVVPGQIVSFKKDCAPLGIVPADARAVVFHGKPRPHEVTETWAKDLWGASA